VSAAVPQYTTVRGLARRAVSPRHGISGCRLFPADGLPRRAVGLGHVLLVPGFQLAGPFPAGLQSYLVFMACLSSASKNADAARSPIKFLTAPAAAPVFKATDIEPG
jgi:hypothetical protein